MSEAKLTEAAPTAARAMRAEWVKFRTLHSYLVTSLSAFVLIVGMAAMLVWVRTGDAAAVTLTELLTGVSWAQLIVAVLATVFACGEWTSGTAQISFLAVPRRWHVLLGKAVALAGVAFGVGALGAGCAVALGVVVGQMTLGSASLGVRVALGAGVYLAGIAVLSAGIAVVVRNVVGAMLTVIGFVWGLPMGITLVPVVAVQRAASYLPAPAGGQLLAGGRLLADGPGAAALTPLAGGAVLWAWALASLVAAALVLHRRDV
ncbi:hypothetical protein [Leucobacter chromiireducens]|uniref:hypothetical protein n=1 Tax=Leucobacter chromiireducens TaxID=283877 RepID=UPI000F6328ED|nr:hypothetical protein [Leucobacter chromiireducens]